MGKLCLFSLVVMAGLAADRARADDTESGFTSLFNGKDLTAGVRCTN